MALQKPYWQVLERKILYESKWVNSYLDTMRLPDGSIIHHHVLDYQKQAAGIVVIDAEKRILLVKVYRFINNLESWEIPSGGVNVREGESVQDGVIRELEEETGYQVKEVKQIGKYYPSNGMSTEIHNVFVGLQPFKVHEQYETNEIMEVQWFAVDKVLAMIKDGIILDGFTIAAVLMVKEFGYV